MNQKGLTPILIILILAVTLLGGYLMYQKYFAPPPQIQYDISEWKTYTNQQFAFSVKYPPNLILKEEPELNRFNFWDADADTVIFGMQVKKSTLEEEIKEIEIARTDTSIIWKLKSKTEITYQNSKGIKIEYESNVAFDRPTIILQRGQYTYSLTTDNQLIDQIISTLEFKK